MALHHGTAPPLPPPAPTGGLREWLQRRIASPAFRRWAAAFPLTRPFARRRAAQLFDLVAGFVYTQVLLACVRLDLFERLADSGPQDAATLAARLQLPLRSMQRLLDAAVALRLLELDAAGRVRLGPLGAPMVGNGAVAAMVEHHAALYADLRDPVALLRDEGAGSAMAAYWPYAAYPRAEQLPERVVAEYSALMTASQPMVIDEVLAAYPLQRHRVLLDVGGGEGRFVAAAVQAAPALQAHLFDLPPVAELACAWLACLGVGARVPRAAASSTTRCRAAPTSPPWCACCSTTTTRTRWPSCGPCARPCRKGPRCWWPSPWRRPRARTPRAMRTSASTCWPWAAASRAVRRPCRRCSRPPDSRACARCAPGCRCRPGCWWRGPAAGAVPAPQARVMSNALLTMQSVKLQ
jgi:hypothetical protein